MAVIFGPRPPISIFHVVWNNSKCSEVFQNNLESGRVRVCVFCLHTAKILCALNRPQANSALSGPHEAPEGFHEAVAAIQDAPPEPVDVGYLKRETREEGWVVLWDHCLEVFSSP